MRRLTADEKKEMSDRILDMVTHGLPPLELMPVPWSVRSQEWFKDSGAGDVVRIFALPGYYMKIFNLKLPPALKACLIDEAEGMLTPDTTIIGATSANWGAQVGLLLPILSAKEFHAYIDKDVPDEKVRQLEACGAIPKLAPDGIKATDYVYQLKDLPNYHLIDQYTHRGSIEGHEWTMDHIARDMPRLLLKGKQERNEWIGHNISIAGAVTGTTSTVWAEHRYLRPRFPGMQVWGVASHSQKEKVPGSRSPEGLDALRRIGGFRYEDAIDGDLITSVMVDEVFAMNAEFVRYRFISAGPTGMLLILGIWHRLEEHYRQYGNLDAFKNDAGMIVAVAPIVDMHLPYVSIASYRKYFL